MQGSKTPPQNRAMQINAVHDPSLPDHDVPGRTSSLAASTSCSTPDRDLINDFEHLSLSVAANESDQKVPVPVGSVSSMGTTSHHNNMNTSKQTTTSDASYTEQISSTTAQDAAKAEVEKIIDVPENSTEITSKTAKPVVHETVKVEHNEVIHKVVHKEIHEYHEYTRILPVVETVLLPAKHFVKTEDGGKVECPLSEIPIGDTASTITYHASGDSMPATLCTTKDGTLTGSGTVKPG